MKPFDLPSALAGEKVVDEKGLEVIEIKYFEKGNLAYPVYVLFKDNSLKAFTLFGYSPQNTLFMSDKKLYHIYAFKDETGHVWSAITTEPIKENLGIIMFHETKEF